MALETLHTLTEKLSTITIFGCRSGSGVNIPHYFEFIGIRVWSEMMEGVIQEWVADDVAVVGWIPVLAEPFYKPDGHFSHLLDWHRYMYKTNKHTIISSVLETNFSFKVN